MHAILTELHRPWTTTGLGVLALGTLDLVYARAPSWTMRHRALRVFFWALYPLLVIFLFSGRKARQDEETHLLYAWVIVLMGLAILTSSIVWWLP